MVTNVPSFMVTIVTSRVKTVIFFHNLLKTSILGRLLLQINLTVCLRKTKKYSNEGFW